MKIIFYRCTCDRKKIDKTGGFTLELPVISCRIKEPSSIYNPTVIIDAASIGDYYADINYAHIPKLGRYYFINDIIMENDGLLSISMSIDVLHTYRSSILDSSQWIVRSEKINSKKFIDPERPLQSNKLLTSKIIGAIPESIGENTNNYYMTVAGG